MNARSYLLTGVVLGGMVMANGAMALVIVQAQKAIIMVLVRSWLVMACINGETGFIASTVEIITNWQNKEMALLRSVWKSIKTVQSGLSYTSN